MKNKAVRLMVTLTAAAMVMGSLAGCGQRVGQETETQKQTAADTQKITEQVTEQVTQEAVKETESETEVQKLITSVDYTSKDGSTKITLPDNTWKVTQDADEMRVFKSADAATINITHASTPAAMEALTYMTTEEDLKKSLTEQYSDASAYEIKSFKTANINGVDTYRYVVKYNTEARMWAYSVTSCIVAKDQAYVITGVVTDDNKTLLSSVQKSVESFRVLNDETLKTVTSEVLSGTTKKTDETVAVGTATSAEEKTLAKYGAKVELVTNDAVNVRKKPGTDSDIIYSMNKAQKVDVVGETKNWFEVNILGNIGYIRKDFLVYPTATNTQTETSASTDTQQTTPSGSASAELNTATNYGSSTTLYTTETVNLRAEPGTSSSVVDQLSGGQALTVVGETDNWFIVSVGGVTGYVSKPYLSSTAPAPSTTDNGGSTGSETNGSSTEGSNTGSTGSGTTGSSAMTSIGGVVTSATADTLTIAGDDGNSYTVYYADANVSSQDGIYSDVYVSISLDPGQAPGDGTLYATNVTGY